MGNDDAMSQSSSSSGSSSSSSEHDAQQDFAEWEESEGLLDMPTRCLLSDEVLPGAEAALARDRERGLDLVGLIAANGLGLYGAIKLVNYVRALVRDGAPTEAVLAAVNEPDALARALREGGGEGDEGEEEEQQLLRPVLEDDPLLFALGELLEAHGLVLDADDAEEEDDEKEAAAAGGGGGIGEDDEGLALPPQVGLLQSENAGLRAEVVELRARVQRMGQLMAEMDAGVKVPKPKLKGPDNDTYYFNSYGHHGIHETMLRDRVRTLAYKEAIEAHAPGLLAGKTVLDVGCGTGVLSMFAAKAGAARVVGVDRSDIIDAAREIVARNKLDGAVTLVKGKVEELLASGELAAALGSGSGSGGKADVIVSEWMGYGACVVVCS